MNKKIFMSIIFIFAFLISDIQAAQPPPWLKEVAKLIAQRSRATGYGHLLRPMTEQEIMIRLLQDPWYRQQLNWIRTSYPDTARNFSQGLQGISKEPATLGQLMQQIESSAVRAAMQNPIPSPHPAPWLPPVFRLTTENVEGVRSSKLIIDSVEITEAELYGTIDDLKRLLSPQLPVRFVMQGSARSRDRLISAIEYLPPGLDPYKLRSGKIVAKIQDPQAFQKVYQQAGKGRFKYCKILGQLCLSTRSISFSLGCGENIELEVTTEGEFSLSISARSRTAEFPLGN